MGRIGASVAGERAFELLLSEASRKERRTENLVENALRLVDTLGEMRGAAMKLGQMLSLHAHLLPPEVAEVLRALQKEAPRAPAEVMRWEVEGALKAKIDELYAELEPAAFAAASIGQVHRGRLHDGRPVAVKIQYPLIDRIVEADLQNLKTLLHAVVSLVVDIDFEAVWRELRDRLLEELDYQHEAANMKRLAALHREVPEIVIPGVVDELTTRNVLTMELVDGIAPRDACSGRYPAELRDRWGQVLFEFQLRGILQHRLLHADPNLANFAFREDGRVVVYDFGSVKEIPPGLAAGYARILAAVLADHRSALPGLLSEIGVHHKGGEPLDLELLGPFLDPFEEILRPSPPYRFGEDDELFDKILAASSSSFMHTRDLRFPEHGVLVNRSLAGHFGNLTRLQAAGPWRQIAQRYAAVPPAG